MDIPREPKKRNVRWLYAGAGLAVLVGATVALGGLRSAAPTVDRSGLWVDTVKRGAMVRQVRGPGTLVPEHIRLITAETAGRVERIEVRPGAGVKADTVLVEIANPDVMLQALEAERQLASAQAELIKLKSELESAKLAQASALATLKAERADARRRAEATRGLIEKQAISDVELAQLKDRAVELVEREQLEAKRLSVMEDSAQQQVQAQRAQVERLRAVAEFRRKQVQSMKVVAGGEGVVQQLDLQLGQWVVPGTLLARVIQPLPLKAELRIPETQARDVTVGQKAQVDTRNGLVPGTVSRVAPAASGGTVLVEVALEGELPRGARPDLNVEGLIELERLDDVLYTSRPAGVQGDTAELFRLDGEARAERVRVKLGRTSVNTIEVLDGLREGDRVILSDMSSWDHAEQLRLQ